MADGRRERKVVTVVFCDLVGFTAQAETLDPEDVEALLTPYHDRVRSELERHGGTVEKFIGDAVMALFGAPVAHEDDPERAVRASIAIRDWAVEEDTVQVRLGVTTGEALVRLDARPEAGEGMASGDVVNTAARLQAAAPVNGVLVDQTTFRATRRVIDYGQAAPVEAKGKTEPVAVWHVVAAHSRFGVDVAHEARSELIGRERELDLVRDAFGRARHDRAPQLLTLVGVPGIGKSRLVWELSRIVDADEELITWRQGRCLAYGDGVTLWALAEIVKAQAAVTEQDAPEDVAEKLRQAAADVLPETDVAWVESHLLALAGLAEQAQLSANRNEAFSAWRRFLEGLAEQRPLVLVFEDLHWADDGLLDFVDELVDWLTDVPLLVVATARPELLERRANWGGGKLNATTLALSPLGDDETARLLGSVLGRSVLPAEAQHALIERAGGNPLYAEQFAELYVERGSIEDLPLPETLQGVIAARLDGLDVDEKSLLQDAAVVGKVFWAAALGREEEATAAAFRSLERKGFVRRQRRSSVEGQTELAFAHALVRDVAYGQIPRAERAARHRGVAEWIESLGRPTDHAEMRAYHWRSAIELARVSGGDDAALVESARLALRDAGDRAFALNSHAAAAALYDEALELWPDTDAERAELLLRRARALYHAYDEGRTEVALEEARDALLEAGDDVAAGEAESWLANVAWDRGEGSRVHEHVHRAEQLVGDARSPSAARVLAVSARMHQLERENDDALRLAELAFGMAEELGLGAVAAHALATLGMAKNDLDGSGTGDMERAVEMALDANSSVAAAIVNNLAVAAIIRADLAKAEELYADAQRLAERFGDGAAVRFIHGNLVWIECMRGDWDRALVAAEAFIADCERSPHTQEANVRTVRAIIRDGRADVEGALQDLRIAVELSRDRVDRGSFIAALCHIAPRLAALGRDEDARAAIDELVPALEVFGPHGVISWLAPTARRLGADVALRGMLDHPLAARSPTWTRTAQLALDGEYVAAADTIAPGGATMMEARLRLYAGRSLAERGDLEESEHQLARALVFFRSAGASAYVLEIEDALSAAQRDSA